MLDASCGRRPPGGSAPTDQPSPATHSTVLQSTDHASSPALWGEVFPASVWRRVLDERTVTVAVDTPGTTLRGARGGHEARLAPIPEGGRTLTAAELAQEWLWVEGGGGTATWSIQEGLDLPPVTVVMPTFRREDDAIAQIRRFLEMDTVTKVIVVDQGGTLEAHAAFTALRARHPELQLVSQPNLGGSGGYARGMLEAGTDPGAAILLSDDDAVLSAESLRRMLTYQALAARPTIIGTPLFSSHRPTHLIAHAETVRTGAFQWTKADRVRGAMDLDGTSPSDWGFLSPRGEANYTGWWGTLLPPGTVSELGLPAPLFLKWDDAEYGLRATAHGYDHAVLPGTAVHHPPWTAYRTQMSWTARVLHRNRLAIAAAYDAGPGVIASSLLHQLKHILAGHLLTAELWESGIEATIAGPEEWMGTDLPHARRDSAEVLEQWRSEHQAPLRTAATHEAPLPLAMALTRATARMILPDAPSRIVLAVHADEVHWRTTLGGDTVLIVDDEGTPENAFVVRGSAMRRALARTLRSHVELARSWRSLHERYRDALPQHTTVESWSRLFTAAADDAIERT